MSLILYGGCWLISRYKGQKCSQGQEQPPLSQGKCQLSVSHAKDLSILAGTEPHIRDHLQHLLQWGGGGARHKSFTAMALSPVESAECYK